MHRSTLPFIAGFLLAVPALAGNPDQSNEGPLLGGTSVGRIGSTFSQSAAQTVTVGAYGRLDRVDMYAFVGGQPSSPLVLEIHPMTAAGLPDSQVLGAREGTPSPIGLQWISFDFSVLAVDVTPGQQLALVLRSDQDLTRGEYDAEGSHDLYAGGAAFVRNGAGPWTAINDYDLMFRTYVRSFALCCTGDFNHDDIWNDDADIEAFFACLAGDCCPTCAPDADFNCDGDPATDADIESFFRVLAGGVC
jgi:hypothetical protein